MLSVPGLGSGLDINAIVDGLVSAEGDAKTQLLASRRNGISSEISAFGNVKNAVDSFRSASAKLASASTFSAFSATSQDTSYFSVSATSTAATGKYDVEIRSLAESQKLISAGFADADTDVGSGTLNIDVGGDSFQVTIDSENQTLADIRNAINNAEDNTGVTATLLTVDDGSGGTLTKLVLTSTETGQENEISITVTDDDGNHTDGNGLSVFYYDVADATTPEQMTEIQAAVDAELYIDNQKILSASNTVSNVLEGVNINLNKAETGVINTLTIATNTSSIKNSIQQFVNSYNQFISITDTLTDYNADTGASGVLIGDATLRTLTNAVRVNISTSLTGTSSDYKNLVDLGITTDDSGALVIDTATLDAALVNNPDDVADLFSSDNGVATQLSGLLNEYTKSGGIIDSKTSGLNESIEDIDEDLQALARSMDALEQRLFAQFSTLDIIMSQLNSTSSFLTQQFEQISNITKPRSNS